MRPKHLMSAGVLLVASVIGVICLRDGKEHQTSTAAGGDDPAVIRNSRTARQLRREAERTRPDLSSAVAMRRLRNLLEQPPSSSHRFETVENWVRCLNDDAIQELIGEVGMEDYAGLAGWVRCALYAEWARRNPQAALAHAEALPDSGGGPHYSVQQVLFSVLRGWAETDPKAAFAEKKRLVRRLGHGNGLLNNLIFEELTRRDPEATWQGCKSSPPKWFFMGLDGRESVAHYLELWAQERWNTDQAHRDFADYKAERRRRDSMADTISTVTVTPVQEPVEERVVVGAVFALAEHDVEGAVAWMSTHGPGDDADRRCRTWEMLSEWATAHPAEALKLIEEDRLQSYTGSLACAAIMGDPSIATAVMRAMDDHSERERAMVLQDVHGVDSIDVLDLFPAPGLPNRLPNFRERYDALLDAVEAGNFKPEQNWAVLRSLHREFQHKLPEAQAAFDALENGR